MKRLDVNLSPVCRHIPLPLFFGNEHFDSDLQNAYELGKRLVEKSKKRC